MKRSAIGLLAGLLASGCLPAWGQDCNPAELKTQIEAVQLEPARSVALKRVRIGTGLATMTLDGVLVPASPVGGRSAEMVFVGDGRIEFAPPDDIEASQLDLFVGSRRLDETFDRAVLVLTLDQAVDAMLGRAASAPEEATLTKARAAWEAWRNGAERKLMGVPGTLLRDACGDPVASGFVAARLSTTDLGDVLLLVDPEDREQFTLGQFVPIEATEREKRKIRRALNRERRRGRLGDVELEDLGQFDNWVSASLRSKDVTVAGVAAFEPSRYVLDVRIDGDRKITATARLELRRIARGTRSVSLRLPVSFDVTAVRGESGEALSYLRTGSQLDVILPPAVSTAPGTVVEVAYAAGELEKAGRSLFLTDTLGWYPQTGELDRARYDVTFHWPRKLELLAPGTRVDGGEKDGERWERRVLDRDSQGFTFEIGRFDVQQETAGRFRLRYAFDPEASHLLDKDVRQEIKASVVGSLQYFEEIFGPLPIDEITVVTTPRFFSQSTPGFITLSTLMMADLGIFARLLGFEDRRTVVAHEMAHQWWGHQMAMESYHDAWLSEGLANYSAVRYRRDRLLAVHDGPDDKKKGRKKEEEDVRVGPTQGWREALTEELEDGRPIESVGPVVLGPRLSSSRADAYEAIVYRKGAVVLDMLARTLGEKQFTGGLKEIARVAAGREVPTAMFFDMLEHMGGVPLEPFERRFVLGTGLPDVYYSYRFEHGEKDWRVVGEARLARPYHFRYRVVATDDGRFDVARARQDTLAALDDLAIAVPVQISFYDPARDEKRDEKRARRDPEPNAQLKGHVALTGDRVPFDIPMEFEPQRFWLDRDAEVFGRFFDESRYPKRMLYYQALDRIAQAAPDEATTLLDKALAAPVFGGDPDEKGAPDKQAIERERRGIDVWCRLSRARLELDRRQVGAAEAALEATRRDLRGASSLTREEVLLLENRILLMKGSVRPAFDELRRAVLRKKTLDGPEAQALLAVAAAAVGNVEERDKAIEQARKLGVDVDLLAPAKGAKQ